MPDFSAHVGQSRKNKFLLTDDPSQVAKSLTPEVAVAGTDRAGDEQGVAGVFFGMGGAVASVSNPQVDYGGADGITGDAILAEYVPPKGAIASVVAGAPGSVGQVFALDAIGRRNQRVDPWTVGKNISLLCDPTKPSKGIVVRGTMLGDAGFDAHVYIAGIDTVGGGSPPIILHHRPANAPQNSTPAYDPDARSSAIGLLSDALRIMGGVDKFCDARATAPSDEDRVYWVYLNGTKHGGNRHSGWLATTFADAEGLLSREVYGPLRAASSLHDLATSDEGRPIRPGAVDCDALFTRGNPRFDAPLWIEDVDEGTVMEPEGHKMRVHCQQDMRDVHAFMCKPGTRPHKRKWWVKQAVVETPPCKGQKPPKPVTGPPEHALPYLPQAYFVGSHLAGGYSFLSHPGA